MVSAVAISEPLARWSLRACVEEFSIPEAKLPTPRRLKWAELDVELEDAELHTERGRLVLHIFGSESFGMAEFMGHVRRLNEPAKVQLDDGACITSPFASPRKFGTLRRNSGGSDAGTRIDLVAWDWLPENIEGLVFIGEVPELGDSPGDNLLLRLGEHKWCRGHFRAEGVFTWHLVESHGTP